MRAQTLRTSWKSSLVSPHAPMTSGMTPPLHKVLQGKGPQYGDNGQEYCTPSNPSYRSSQAYINERYSAIIYGFLCHWPRDTHPSCWSGPAWSAQHVPLLAIDGTDRASNMTVTAKISRYAQPNLCPPPYIETGGGHWPGIPLYTAHALIVGHGPPLLTALRRFRGRDAKLCRSRRHVMCRIRH